MLVRVFEIPAPTGNYHFGGGEPQTFIEVDWFRNDPGLNGAVVDFATPSGREKVTQFIKNKRYLRTDKAYLVLHPHHPFTIGYEAP